MSNRSDKLKEIILQQYHSVRAFAQEAGIPHGTLVSALNNDIDGMAWSRFHLICEKLQIDPVSLAPLCDNVSADTKAEKRLLAYYKQLNTTGREKVDAYLEDISRIYSEFEK